MTNYYVDKDGVFLGGYDGANPPPGAIKITNLPDHATDKWDGNKWVPSLALVAEQAQGQRRAQAFDANLPTWAQVNAYIDAAFTMPQRGVVKKLARVIYWLAKGTED